MYGIGKRTRSKIKRVLTPFDIIVDLLYIIVRVFCFVTAKLHINAYRFQKPYYFHVIPID